MNKDVKINIIDVNPKIVINKYGTIEEGDDEDTEEQTVI